MNRKQLKAMWIGIAVFTLMGLFPPNRYGGYDFIAYMEGQEIGWDGLSIQWIVVAVITAGLIVTFKDKKQKKDEQE